ncbi:hypothetical protein ABT316_19240 [Streptomyces cellulosae]
MTHQTDHENTADKAAVTPPPALTTEGRLRARVQTLEEDAERNQGLAKVGARCMREGHQGLIESGRATVEGHRFALSVKLGLGTDATWDAIHERVKELRVDSAEPAAVSAAVAPPTNPTHGLSVPHADALWDAVAIPGPHTPTYPEQHERVCRAVRDILDELTPARDETAARTALRDRIADTLAKTDGWVFAPGFKEGSPTYQGFLRQADAVLAVLPSAADWDALVREADRLRRDGKALHARAEEIDTQLTALRQQVTEPADRAAVLSAAERAMLTYALDQAQEHIWSRDGFTDEDQAAVDSLRRLTAEPAAGARQDGAET